MRKFIKEKIQKHLIKEEKEVSVNYLSQLLKNVNKNMAKKFLKRWIKRGQGSDKVKLSSKEKQMLEIIKRGGPNPEDFGSKN